MMTAHSVAVIVKIITTDAGIIPITDTMNTTIIKIVTTTILKIGILGKILRPYFLTRINSFHAVYTKLERMVLNMDKTTDKSKNLYDDGNIPKVDLPKAKNSNDIVEPLPESTRPRKDGPGGD